MDVERTPLPEHLKRSIAENLAIGRARRDWERRYHHKFPLRNRWLIVKARSRTTWRERWADLIYLVLGR